MTIGLPFQLEKEEEMKYDFRNRSNVRRKFWKGEH
jgi:hypothetical protein